MRPETEDTTGLLVAIAMFQGIYKRVATKVGVDDSLVSRVVKRPAEFSEGNRSDAG